ncbi:MAG: precorrin-6A reductase [Lachnospiraceae bacterium]|nr:precorrin-6A reductase [Lachnospiraceae bacterium]
MTGCIVFSGTTEGRILSDALSAHGIKHIVCVAGTYGEDMMEDDPARTVHVGRMDEGQMKEFFSSNKITEEGIIIDATHPYASEVTANIKSACEELNLKYVRVVRSGDESAAEGFPKYANAADCAKELNKTDSNILLTTGSKELGTYAENVSKEVLDRTYVRVLPSIESLELCEKAGIEKSHIIAMHGPFSAEMNEALIRQYSIKHLVTKESGASGGFEEKILAARNEGITAHIIERPSKEEGVSVEAALSMMLADMDPKMNITIAGLGMGSEGNLTLDAHMAIKDSDVIFGAERLIAGFDKKKYPLYLAKDIIPVLESEKPLRPVILYSGDVSFYSGTRKMIAALKDWREDINIRVLPGISSISYLASKIGTSYDDAKLFSLHGHDSDEDLAKLIDLIKYNSKVFTLLSGAKDIHKIAEAMIASGITGSITAGNNLSYDDESVITMSSDEALAYDNAGITTAFISNPAPARKPLINVIKDSDMIRTDVPMTKECIRHESIIRLELCEGDVLYDVGGGTGSVSIEAASLSRDLKVYTFEKKPEAVKLIKENIKKAGLYNIEVIEGNAPDTFEGITSPDKVFIGGSEGRLSEIIAKLSERKKGIRYVVNAVSLETIDEVKKVMKDFEAADEEIIQISVSGVRKAGEHHLLSAQNPVWIFSFTI